jgi:hypothetical protein
MKFFLYQFVLLFVAITFLAIPKVGAAEPEQLVSLRRGYVDAHVAALEPITKKYYIALAELREKLTKEGNLEAALIVKSEESNTNKTELSKQPRQLIALNRIYKQVCDRESAQVTKKYVSALKKLQDKLTRAGYLEDALIVKTEHQKCTSKERTGNDSGPNFEVANISAEKALKLRDGAKPWSNRDYVFVNLPKEFKGMSYYQYTARSRKGLTIKVHNNCEVKIIVGGHKVDLPALEKWLSEGWNKMPRTKITITYGAPPMSMFVLSKQVKAGDTLKVIDYSVFGGIIVLTD